jgi:carbonic anhydrase/acetyltransferase-like protein (isoleucine patch superfamily)
MSIYSLDNVTPNVSDEAWVSLESTIIGDVTLGALVSVWPGAVIRGDNDEIVVGERTNIQEGAVLHTDPGFVLQVGTGVSIGHQGMLHGCSVGNGSLIGIQAIVLNGASVGEQCLIGAGALVTAGTIIPSRSLVLGSPAKVIRRLSDEEIGKLEKTAEGYVERAQRYRKGLKRIAQR